MPSGTGAMEARKLTPCKAFARLGRGCGGGGRGNSSVVEHNLAKVGVAGSNPVSRSIQNLVGGAIRPFLIDRAA
jgi:hypothetical protein